MSTADDIPNSLSSGIPPDAPDGMAAILGRMRDGFLALDTDGRIIYVNEPAAQVFGRRREALAGRPLWGEFPEGVGNTGAVSQAVCSLAGLAGDGVQLPSGVIGQLKGCALHILTQVLD